MKNMLTALVVYGIINCAANAQVSVNSNAALPAASAMLDVSSANKGVLLPRMTSAQKKAIPNPAVGLMVFDTDRQAFCFFDGQDWRPLLSGSENAAITIQRTGSNTKPNGQFGKSVAIHGNYAVVGAPRDSTSGCAYVFVKENGNWKQQAKLVASYMGTGDEFGYSVGIYNDIIVVGAPGMKVGANDKQGRVYLFKRTGNSWQQLIGLQSNVGQAQENFGHAVSIHDKTIAIGAPGRDYANAADAGAVYIIRNTSGTWEHRSILLIPEVYVPDHTGFGAALDLDGDKLVIGAPSSSGTGAAYSFINNDALGYSWTSIQKLSLGSIPGSGTGFGSSIAMSGTNLVIGMPNFTFSMGEENGGLWYTYIRNPNGQWFLLPSHGSFKAHTLEGSSVAVDGDTFYVGSEGWTEHDGLPAYKGRVVIYKNNKIKHVYNIDKDVYGFFGASVAADNGQYIIGAPAINNSAIGTVTFGIDLE